MSDRIKITRVLAETETCFRAPLSGDESRFMSNMLGAMKLRIPRQKWCDTPDDALSALHLRNLIESGAMSYDSLNAKGWDALQFANDMIEKGKRIMSCEAGRTRRIS